MKKLFITALFTIMLILSLPLKSYGCACGCNVFCVGGRWMMSPPAGYRISMMYNYMDQNSNWNAASRASSDLNEDKEIATSFYTLDLRSTINEDWGIAFELPVWDRLFSTTDDDGKTVSARHSVLGDMRLMGMYSGIFDDLSTTLIVGIKLPTGSYQLSLLDRDTQIGTGTTDILLGGYYMNQKENWGWFIQIMSQVALNEREGYRPGNSIDLNAGIHYDNLTASRAFIPVLQLIGSLRGIDSGINADPDNTGYQRLYFSPGVEVNLLGSFKLYGDVRIPLLTHVNGYQLVAPALLNMTLSFGV